MEPRILLTSNGIRVETNMTDAEAFRVCCRVVGDSFVSSLVRQYRDRGLTARQIPYLHLNALRQLERETAAQTPAPAPVQTPAPAPVVRATPAPAPVVTPINRNGTPLNRELRAAPAPTTDAPSIVKQSDENLGRLFQIEYDIPLGEERLITRGRRRGQVTRSPVYPNPSDTLRRFAIRTSESKWVVPENRIPYVLIQEMREAGCVVWDIPLDMGGLERIREWLAYNLRKEIGEREQSYRDSLAKAGEQTSEDKIDRHINNAAGRMTEFLEDIQHAAGIFGLDINEMVQTTFGKVATLQTESYRRARVYAAAVRTAQETGTTDAVGIARAATMSEEAPVGVLADALEDAGQDEAADTLRREFRVGTYSQTGRIDDDE